MARGAGRLQTRTPSSSGTRARPVFVDPTRAHLYDVAKGLEPADRAAIMARQAGYDEQFIFAARLHEAQAKGDAEAVARGSRRGPGRGRDAVEGRFEPLSGEESKVLSGQVHARAR